MALRFPVPGHPSMARCGQGPGHLSAEGPAGQGLGIGRDPGIFSLEERCVDLPQGPRKRKSVLAWWPPAIQFLSFVAF